MTGFLEHVLRGAEALAARDPVGTLPDAELLRRFAAERDQAAFAVLVRRHGPLVWGVCRNLLPRDADAEDAFQATFLALVRGADGVRRPDALGGWLHGVAYRVALRARRTAARRKRRETVAAVGETDLPVADAAWDELQAAVHEEVRRLPEKLRLPFVLCTLQGRGQRDAADQLGWKLGTLSGRLSQARQRLLDRLARRGVPSAAVALGAAAGAAGVPSNLCAITFQTALAPDRASPAVLSLARGVTLMARTKLIVAGVLIAGALTTGIGTRLLSTADAQAPPPDPNAEDIRKAIDFLKANPSAAVQDRWEYKFVPVEQRQTAADLQKVLTQFDRDGWEYCGAQDLWSGNPRQEAGQPHLTFKRPRTAARDAATRALLEEALKAIGEKPDGEARRNAAAALRDAQRVLDAQPDAEAKARDQYRKQLLDAQRALLSQTEAAQKQQAAAERDRAELERIKARQAEAAARARAEDEAARKAREADERGMLELERAVREAEQRALADKLKAQQAPPKKEAAGKAGDPVAPEIARTKALIEQERAALELKFKQAAVEWKNMADARAAEAQEHQARIKALEADLQKTRAQAEQMALMLQELQAQQKGAARKAAEEKPQPFTIFHVKHASAAEVAQVLEKVMAKTSARIVVDAAKNTILVAGPDDALADVKKVIAELDRPAKK